MSEWFHAEGSRQVGPVSSEEIGSLFRDNRIGLDTLVWREGLPAWQPLRSVVAELGLTAVPPAPLPPPVPPAPDPTIPSPVSPASIVPDSSPYAGAGVSRVPPMAMQPAKKGLSGCALTAIIGGAALLVLVPVCAILAAIALPAYNDYTIRAKVAQSIATLQPLKAQVQEFHQIHSRCPSSSDPGFPAHDAFTAQGLSSVQLGQFENAHCGIEATLGVGKPQLDGDLLWLEYSPADSAWECSSDTTDKYLPVNCRG